MAGPLFSIVVPTRNRASTLRSAVQSCVDQNFDDYEIVVFDNCSSGETKEVVDGFSSPRIKYHASSDALAMTDSWETALSFASGEYITVLGDDDGLMPNGLKVLAKLLDRFPTKAMRWASTHYRWPNHPEEEKKNVAIIPLGESAYSLESATMIRLLGRFETPYESLPMLYNAVVHRDVLQRIRDKAGRVFLSSIPDIASGIAIASAAEEYVALDFSIGVAGISGLSNGASSLSYYAPNSGGRDRFADFVEANKKAGMNLHADLPNLYLLSILVADAFLRVKEELFPSDNSLSLDSSAMLKHCAHDLRQIPKDFRTPLVESLPDRFQQPLSRLLADDSEDLTQGLSPDSAGAKGFSLRKQTLCVDLSNYGVESVAEAARFCDDLVSLPSLADRCRLSGYRKPFTSRLRTAARAILKGDPPGFWT